MNRKLSSRRIYEGRIINLRLDQVELPDGRRTEREIVEHPGAAVVVPVGDDGSVHLVIQYRDAASETLLELPAGKLEPGEGPAGCARRELLEELGLEAGKLEPLGSLYSSPGFCEEVLHLFLARELRQCEAEMDHDEFIEAEVRPLGGLDQWLGEIRDAKSVAGILLAWRLSDGRA